MSGGIVPNGGERPRFVIRKPQVLIYEFKNTRPIELSDFTLSLLALADQYKLFIRRIAPAYADDDFKLYVDEVRNGSIVAQLVDAATQGQLYPYAPFIGQFAQQLSDWFDVLKGIKDTKEVKDFFVGTTKKDLQQISQLIEPAAKDHGSQINFIAKDGGSIVVNVSLPSIEANAVQNGVRRRIEATPDAESGIHRDEVLYWYQVRADVAERPGDKAIIERFSKRPVKVRFYSDSVKRQMLDRDENPFLKMFIVDVDVSFVAGRPVLYRVLEVKDTIEPTEVTY